MILVVSVSLVLARKLYIEAEVHCCSCFTITSRIVVRIRLHKSGPLFVMFWSACKNCRKAASMQRRPSISMHVCDRVPGLSCWAFGRVSSVCVALVEKAVCCCCIYVVVQVPVCPVMASGNHRPGLSVNVV